MSALGANAPTRRCPSSSAAADGPMDLGFSRSTGGSSDGSCTTGAADGASGWGALAVRPATPEIFVVARHQLRARSFGERNDCGLIRFFGSGR
jgi:hypothetical protein